MKNVLAPKAALGLLVIVLATALVSHLGNNLLHADVDDADLAESSRLSGLETLLAKAEEQGDVPLIVGLDVPDHEPTKLLEDSSEALQQQAAITHAQNRLLKRLSAYNVTGVKQFRFIPFMALTVDAAGLKALYADPAVISVEEDVAVFPTLAQTIPLIRANHAHTLFYDGSGQKVAILDTGVDKNHSALAGKVVSEACYSTTNSTQGSTSLCPGGASSSTASGSGLNCNTSISGCDHGTHVAGIAAGVAPDADIIAMQVFSRFSSGCGARPAPCVKSFTSDQIDALERVFALRNTFDIASVNMSLGGGQFTTFCDTTMAAEKAAIDNLRNAGIATVIAAGNDGFTNSMSSPACISSAISVGATTDNDQVASFSNLASFTTMLAPGVNIYAPVPGNQYDSKNGTSMAAPHVAGAIAILKEASPGTTVTGLISRFVNTGPLVTDQRAGGSVTKRRLDVYGALCAQITCDSNDYRYISVGGSLNGTISPFTDKDHYFFNGSAGNRLTLNLIRTSGAMDPYLELFDPQGNRVAFNDNGGTGNNAWINGYQLQRTGRYLITARSKSNSTGNYRLEASQEFVQLNPVPQITRLSPSSATGTLIGSNFWVGVYGRNFVRGAQVRWNGQYRSTYFSHSGLVWVRVQGSDLGLPWPRIATIQVRNPTPGGGYSNPMPFNITFPFLGESELVAPEGHGSIPVEVRTTFVISWTHPISSWREMQNLDLRLRDENNETALWVRMSEAKPTSTLSLLNAAATPVLSGTLTGGEFGEDRDLVLTDTVTLHLGETKFSGSGRTVIVSPTVSFGENAIGNYNIEFTVDNEQGEIQDDDVLGTFSILPAGCTAPLTDVSISGTATGMVDTPYAYSATITPTDATMPISYTWSPEPESGQGTSLAIYEFPSAGEKVIAVTAENCGAFTADVKTVAIRTTTAPDLSISKTGPAVALAGEPITYTLVLTNSGGATAANPSVLDTLPSGATYVSGGTKVGDTVLFSPPDLDGFGTVTYTSFVVTASSDITNSDYAISADGGHSATGSRSVSTRIVDVRVHLTPTTTGQLSTSSTEITIPGGAVFADTTIAFDEISSPTYSTPSGSQFAGRAFSLDAYQQNRRLSSLELGETISVTVHYSDGDVAGLNEESLNLLFWNGSEWSASGVSCQRNPADNRLDCTVENPSMTQFALFETEIGFGAEHQIFLPAVIRNFPPTSDYAQITGIAVEGDHYAVSFQTYGFTPTLPGQHVHFFFDTVPPDQAGVPGSGPWYVYGGASPFTNALLTDRPSGAEKMCVLVANSNHSVQANSGNCYDLP